MNYNFGLNINERIDNTIPWDEVVDELLKGTEFENNNKNRGKERLTTN